MINFDFMSSSTSCILDENEIPYLFKSQISVRLFLDREFVYLSFNCGGGGAKEGDRHGANFPQMEEKSAAASRSVMRGRRSGRLQFTSLERFAA